MGSPSPERLAFLPPRVKRKGSWPLPAPAHDIPNSAPHNYIDYKHQKVTSSPDSGTWLGARLENEPSTHLETTRFGSVGGPGICATYSICCRREVKHPTCLGIGLRRHTRG